MYPKQFIPLRSDSDNSLVVTTLQRFTPEQGFQAPTLLCNDDYRFLLTDEVEKSGVAPREILLEPVARSTAPAIAAAVLSIAEEAPDAIIAVIPSDHAIEQAGPFHAALARATELAAQNHLVLFGTMPDRPHTGYGYIRKGAPLNCAEHGGYRVEAFVEKPDQETAMRFLNDGGYCWNSGMAVFPAALFLAELERLEPALLDYARTALAHAKHDLAFRRLEATAYANCPEIPVDYAVMERTDKAVVLPLDAGWSDVGSWNALWELEPHDENGNAVKGDALLVDTRNSYVHSEGALISTLGVDDTVVVQTGDAVLVTKRDRASDVGALVAQLKLSNRREHEQHIRNHRPWGFFETLSLGSRFQVKRLHVKPGAQLSLQMHHHRSEHWVVVKGTAKVVRDDEEKLVCENESVYISATQWHRLENPGKVPLEVIEIQIGSYLGEDDIIRSNDIYHRGAHETR